MSKMIKGHVRRAWRASSRRRVIIVKSAASLRGAATALATSACQAGNPPRRSDGARFDALVSRLIRPFSRIFGTRKPLGLPGPLLSPVPVPDSAAVPLLTETPPMGVILTGLTPAHGLAAVAAHQGLLEPIALADFTLARVRQYQALVVPFRSHHSRLWDHRAVLFEFLRMGGRVFLQADAPIPWLSDAVWEDRPGRNYWWVTRPELILTSKVDSGHPAFMGLRSPYECWHARGAYTRLPGGAHIIQQNPHGETLTWQTAQFGGLLLVTTLDPLPDAEPGMQNRSTFDRYCDQLTNWLLDRRPAPRPRPIGAAVNIFSFATVDEALSKGV